jgi:hypothetical protein
MKTLILLTSLVFLTISLFAKKVEISIAQTVAKNLYVLQYSLVNGDTIQLPTITETYILEKENETVIYVFNFKDGFAFISADDAVIPVLGFSLNGKYSEINKPPALRDLIEHYKNQIIYIIRNQFNGSEDVLYLWSLYSNPENRNGSSCQIWPKYFIVNPLLSTTWDQNCYYNQKCPLDLLSPIGYCNHVPNGCVAVAMAQVMKYWNYPITGTGSNGYYDGSQYPNSYGYQYANFGSTIYNWSNMPNFLTGDGGIESDSPASSIDAVSTLIYHCGVSVNMDYGYDGSGAQTSATRDALVSYFNYSSQANYKIKSDYSNGTWESILRNDISNHNPIIYKGQSPNNGGGHAFVLDGFVKMQTELITFDAFFHVNWGWGGNYNGNFYLNDLTPGNFTFNDNQAAVVNITAQNPNYNPPPRPSYISEPACSPHCRDIEVDYFVPQVNEATSYEWDITGITAAGVIGNNRYAIVWSHHYGTGTLWCRALNHDVPGPWQTRTIHIENCSENTKSNVNDKVNNKPDGESAFVGKKYFPEALNIFPNPASNIINFTIPYFDEFSKIQLIDTQGNVVKSIKVNSSDVILKTEDILPGLYFVKLYSLGNIQVEKVTVSK